MPSGITRLVRTTMSLKKITAIATTEQSAIRAMKIPPAAKNSQAWENAAEPSGTPDTTSSTGTAG